MKFSYNHIRNHYQLTDLTPGIGQRVIDTDINLDALLRRHGMLEEETPPDTLNDPSEGDDTNLEDLLD